MIEEITIKFGTELKPTQVSWKSQLYKILNSYTLYHIFEEVMSLMYFCLKVMEVTFDRL